MLVNYAEAIYFFLSQPKKKSSVVSICDYAMNYACMLKITMDLCKSRNLVGPKILSCGTPKDLFFLSALRI